MLDESDVYAPPPGTYHMPVAYWAAQEPRSQAGGLVITQTIRRSRLKTVAIFCGFVLACAMVSIVIAMERTHLFG